MFNSCNINPQYNVQTSEGRLHVATISFPRTLNNNTILFSYFTPRLSNGCSRKKYHQNYVGISVSSS